MKKQFYTTTLSLISLFLASNSIFSQDIGATFAWQFEEIYGGHVYPFNQSIVTNNLPSTTTSPRWFGMDQWWENLAEEIEYSGLDYIALLSRGNQPDARDRGNGNPQHIPKMINAMNLRNINSFKLAIFDDCPNSWSGSKNWNDSKGVTYSSEDPKFDCSIEDNYRYIWDYNLKQAIGHIPDERRYKIDGRMVIIFWSVKPTWMINIEGNLTKILQHIKTQCMATYGIEPYFVIDKDWLNVDSTLKNSPLVDAVHGWFSAAGKISYTLENWTDVKTNTIRKTGALVPGFGIPTEPATFLDAGMGTTDQGARLKLGLDNTLKQGASLTLVEGFSDAAEAAALWRSTDEGQLRFYNYANQRLNILRRYSKNPFPAMLKMEAEACDFNFDLTATNTGGAFLERGNLDVIKSNDVRGGWIVTNTEPTEWMEWKELPLLKNTRFQLRYKSTASSSIKFSIDGNDLSTITLPSTSGVWTTIDAGDYFAGSNSLHDVKLTIVTGKPDINYFLRINSGNVAVTDVTVSPTTANIVVGFNQQLTASVSPFNASNEAVTWTSSDSSVATVSAFGLVTAVAAGTAIITVTTVDGAKTATSTITVAQPSATSLQAEDAVLNGATISTANTGYRGTGYAYFTNASNDFIKWTFTAPNAGNYDLSFRYALPNTGRPLELKINGNVVIASLTFPGTGSFLNWSNIASVQVLKAGVNEIMLSTIGSNGGNIDELVITNLSSLGTADVALQPIEKGMTIYPNPLKNGVLSIDLEGIDSTPQLKVKIINLLGQTVYQSALTNSRHLEIDLTGKLNAGVHFVSVEAGSVQFIKKLVVK